MLYLQYAYPLNPSPNGYNIYLSPEHLKRIESASFFSFTLYTPEGKMIVSDDHWANLQLSTDYLIKDQQGGVTVTLSSATTENSFYSLSQPNQAFTIVWRIYDVQMMDASKLQPSITVIEDA